jgi:hypothetical protein
MIKLISKICFVCSFVFMGTTQAALIGVTEEDYYITFNYDTGINIDVAWVSSVNTERYYFSDFVNQRYNINTLYSPDKSNTPIGGVGIGDGWHYAEDNALSSSLLGSFSSYAPGSLLDYFTTAPETYIHAFEYWNSYISDVSHTGDMSANKIASEWSWNVASDDDNVNPVDPLVSKLEWNLTPDLWSISDQADQQDRITSNSRDTFDTLYFRVHDAQNNATSVPEPSTLMIFALGLIALASKKRLFS